MVGAQRGRRIRRDLSHSSAHGARMNLTELYFNIAVVAFLVAAPFLVGYLGEMAWAKMRK